MWRSLSLLLLSSISFVNAQPSIYHLIKDDGRFTNTFIYFVDELGFNEPLATLEDPLTVFPFTDTAWFTTFPDSCTPQVLGGDLINAIVLHHIFVGGAVPAGQMDHGVKPPMAGGEETTITRDGDAIWIDDARLIEMDAAVENPNGGWGAAHVINRVLIPPSIRNSLPPECSTPPNFLALAASHPDGLFSDFIDAVSRTGLTADFEQSFGPFTVFLPTNDAFANLPSGIQDCLLRDENVSILRDIVLYHVHSASIYPVMSWSLADGQEPPMSNGQSALITIQNERGFINQAEIIGTNFLSRTGVLYIIDQVLVPPSFDPSICAATVTQTTAPPTAQPTVQATAQATAQPTDEPTAQPTHEPTAQPTDEPTAQPTDEPTSRPTSPPVEEPTAPPTAEPTMEPTAGPTAQPTEDPTAAPTAEPTMEPTETPVADPTDRPTMQPVTGPTKEPTREPTSEPTRDPTLGPTAMPTLNPTADPTAQPVAQPTAQPVADPTANPTAQPVADPTANPTAQPVADPTANPTAQPVADPTARPTLAPINSDNGGGWGGPKLPPRDPNMMPPQFSLPNSSYGRPGGGGMGGGIPQLGGGYMGGGGAAASGIADYIRNGVSANLGGGSGYPGTGGISSYAPQTNSVNPLDMSKHSRLYGGGWRRKLQN